MRALYKGSAYSRILVSEDDFLVLHQLVQILYDFVIIFNYSRLNFIDVIDYVTFNMRAEFIW